MAHENRLFDDTSAEIAAMLIQHWRDTPPLQKLAQMSSLNATLEQLALAGLARQYPDEPIEQLRWRYYQRNLEPHLIALIQGGSTDDHART